MIPAAWPPPSPALPAVLVLGLSAAYSAAGAAATGQAVAASTSPRTTTIAALTRYPLFFHGHRVRVQGAVTPGPIPGTAWLADGPHRVLLLSPADAAPGADTRLEVLGSFWDVGRLEPDDSRLAGLDVAAAARAVLGRERPGQGELLVLRVDQMTGLDLPGEPTIRALALDPARYEGRRVTVVGRFRGANLYGDLPAAPGRSRWDFVLQSADAAVWVTGLRPRGRGFDLRPQARVDTGRWLRVAGIVRHAEGLVWLEGQTVELADEPPAAPAAAPVRAAVPSQPPAVIFSAPVQDDVDVPPSTEVRIQFSRDMNAASFEGRVRVSYVGGGDPLPPPPAFTATYRPAVRALEIRFAAPLERFHTVRVELLEGITASDGLPLAPWSLTFTLGGRAPSGWFE